MKICLYLPTTIRPDVFETIRCSFRLFGNNRNYKSQILTFSIETPCGIFISEYCMKFNISTQIARSADTQIKPIMKFEITKSK